MSVDARRVGGLTAPLAHFIVIRTLAFVLLIVNEHVSHIGGYTIAQSKESPRVLFDTHRLAKRMDLEICLAQFDVHNNTIIRTGESQAIGGKFLQGLELETLVECQRLCCETDSCDVFIFEEKNGGYCYLFECGPPENFHCKFTRHSNYTSAVLTPLKVVTTPRPPPPPPPPPQPVNSYHQQITPNLSQQEWELTNLKAKPDKLGELETDMSNSYQQQQQQQQQKQKQIDKVANTTTQQCSRFQFPCHSGECIAVYNACDGIPQCEDGSDEGPECSGATNNNVGSMPNSKGNVETANIIPSALDTAAAAAGQKSPYRTVQQTTQQQLQSLQQQPQQQQQSLQTPIVNNREDAGAWANRKIVAGAQQADDGGDLNSHIFTHKNGLQLPSNSNSNNNNNVGILESSSGGSNTGAIDMNGGVASYANSNANLSPIYASNIQRTGVYLPQVVPPQTNEGMYAAVQQGQIQYLPANVNWGPQQQMQQYPMLVTPLSAVNERTPQLAPGPAYVINTPQQAVPHYQQQKQQQQQQPSQGNDQQTKIAFMPAPNLDQGKLQDQQQQQHQQQDAAPQSNSLNKVESDKSKSSTKKVLAKQYNAATNDSYEDYDDQSTEAPKKKPHHKHKKIKPKTSSSSTVAKESPNIVKSDISDDPVQQSIAERKQQQSKVQPQPPSPVHEQYRMMHEFRDHDGQSDRPGGAVLSLTLGVLVTAALAILIGCRMRTVGRRARRLGGKFSHDPDFLVNGMYL